MEMVLRPSWWMYVVAAGLLAVAGFIYFFTAAPLIFLTVLVLMASLILLGFRTRMTLGEKSIEQSGNPFSRYNWQFVADEIESWSEVSASEAHWLALAPDDREIVGEPDPLGWQERFNRYFLFRLSDSGETIQVNPVFSSGRNQAAVRRWLATNVGNPLQGDEQLHWFIDKNRDRRCYLKRAIREDTTMDATPQGDSTTT